MSKFNEIQDQYKTLVVAESAYWVRLEKTRRQIRTTFGEYLGINADEKVGINGETRLWFGGKKDLSGKSEHDLARDSNELVFTLNLILDKADTTFPPNNFGFRIRLKHVADMFMVREESSNRWMTVEEDFTPLYDHLWKELNAKMSTFARL